LYDKPQLDTVSDAPQNANFIRETYELSFP
jgi:hypothetical protein